MTDLFDDFVAELRVHEMDPEVARSQRSRLEKLVLAPPRRNRKRALVIGAGVVALAAAGVGTAAAFGMFSAPPSDRTTAFCYSSAALTEDPAGRIEFAVSGPGTSGAVGDAAASGIDICSAYWRAGVLEAGAPPRGDVVPGGGTHPVPKLVACVLPTGQLGVFPGDELACARMGLPNAVK
jgi:hypothetical protein